MSTVALPTDWQTAPMPNEKVELDYQRAFSAQEFEQIRQGFIPMEMEDKWFIYCDNNTLNFHRSWTGHHIFQVTLVVQPDNSCTTTRLTINRNQQQYKQDNNNYDIATVDFLINRLLLGKEVPFTFPESMPETAKAIYQHSMVGYATTASAYNTPPSKIAALSVEQRLLGCLVGGAIGDAWGSSYEGQSNVSSVQLEQIRGITDDTQLTLATCEAILASKSVSPQTIAARMLAWYNNRKLTGLGASTLKALRDLQVGAHWGLSGRSGEYAAGNGAAMRIAPLAFFTDPHTDQTLIRDICCITHKNDEAYAGCLAVLHAIDAIRKDIWFPDLTLSGLIVSVIPDTAVRDNIVKLYENPALSIARAAQLVGCSGHVIESVPFAIFAAGKIKEKSAEEIYTEIILCGGDTDTNASIAGNIMGAFIGLQGFSPAILAAFEKIKESTYILQTGKELAGFVKG
ncbi:ADP-ribosylglycohydrolase [Filimonas zeae]|uniref:ADP-ribosylglycohydrolase n=1 Tax=Filimonas zeae TaxID=1737353 RepID=A0A917IZW8_9BACT|nr:ADP-ribosylglycohydrolase family protein [Filimonas zeae]MDR6339653.1 ADP-ribosylglycohydrolase [Filimonas zeae]GGH68992.1 hypothetical protein GCM10011379_25830 [Filimonas zeae]